MPELTLKCWNEESSPVKHSPDIEQKLISKWGEITKINRYIKELEKETKLKSEKITCSKGDT